MQYFVNAQEMKDCDMKTIEEFGVPSIVLMERAALAFTEELLAFAGTIARAGIVCGMGNNGGDGIAVARLLKQQGIPVQIYLIGEEEKASKETAMQLAIARNYQVSILHIEQYFHGSMDSAQAQLMEEFSSCSVLVDAIFGIGLSRTITGLYANVIDCMNRCSSIVCSVDIPSGIDSSTGQVLGCAICAQLTVTFAYSKAGLVLFPGAAHAGTVITKPIGITEDSFGAYRPALYTCTSQEILQMLPARRPDSNKGTYGKVVLVAGSRGMAGAAYLAAMAAYRTGCGLVRIITPKENRQILQSLIPEALLTEYDPQHLEDEWDNITQAVRWGTVVGIGPGLGTSSSSRILFRRLLANAHAPLIIDADGLNLLSQELSLLEQCGQPVAVTPHLGEMARLSGQPIEQIKSNLIQTAKEFATQYRVCCVLKDAHTVVAAQECSIYVNLTGNSGMSAGGSGDILTGMICGLAAQGIELNQASVIGVHLHGRAGDLAAKSAGERGMMARDLLDSIPAAFCDVPVEPV